MPQPILGPDAVHRDVRLAPARLARETELVNAAFTVLAPWLNALAEAAEETDEAAEAAVRAVWRLADGEPADADAAHDRLMALARECEESGDYDDAACARIARLAAAWLSIKSGRRLRDTGTEDDPWSRFGGLVNVLALPRLDRDYRELFGALENRLAELDGDAALAALFPALGPLPAMVAAAEVPERVADGTERPPLDVELRRFAAGAEIDVAALHGRLASLALAAEEEVDMDSHRRSEAAWTLAVWLRMRCGEGFVPTPNVRGLHTAPTVRSLLERIVWARAKAPVERFDTVRWHPEHCDLYAVIREIEAVYRQVTGTGIRDPHRTGT